KNQSALSKRIEGAIEAVYDVENAMKDVDKEMERIENEVLPEIEQAVDSTRIPHQSEPPYPIPNSKLWMDTSVNPPVLKIWDEESETWEMLGVSEEELAEITEKVQDAIDSTTIPSQDEAPKDEDIPKSNLWWDTSIEPASLMRWDGTKWVVLTQTKEEIDELMEQMRDEAVIESKEYSEAEIKATRQAIINQLNEELNDVNTNMTTIEKDIDSVIGRVSSAEKTIDKNTNEITSAQSKISSLEVTADDITTQVSDIKSDLTTAQKDITKVEQTAGKIESTVSSVRTELDELEIGGTN